MAGASGNRNETTDATASAFAGSAEIPDKCISADEVQDGVVVVVEACDYELPVIDMAKLVDPELSENETAKLGSACRSSGFFQLINHGIDGAVIKQMKDNTTQFLSLPLDTKKAVAVREDGFEGYDHHHYTRSSSATAGDNKLDWAESVILINQPVEDRNVALWRIWPTDPPKFRLAHEIFSVEIMNLTRQLVTFMAVDLKVDEEALLNVFCGKRQSLVIHYYPPCRHREKAEGNRAHTLLLHVDDTPGLKVKNDGMWFPVRPLPGAFVVNIGDIVHIVTNGTYKSVVHTVVLVDAERCRTTDGLVTPLPPELLKGGEAEHYNYRSVERFQCLKVRFSSPHRFLGSFKL